MHDKDLPLPQAGVGGRGLGDQECVGVGGKGVVCRGHGGGNISHGHHKQVLEEMIQDKRHMMSVVFGKLHGVKSSKSVTFNSFVGLHGNEASHVERNKQHDSTNDECSDGRNQR